ncbi:hypothetical protein SARC_00193 [Sphaeroforma arctica JP610]|uniref:Enoyl-CoA hydratase n=1 Tax=Sphaeroforma arctica JP610 TaxID=667725 RepID=A0A0L0GF69_9EUKA|nr:hypothetical protein SARC_00193 [Sphaeroforma arctica JP610]KNC87685.1 hypothetical protein SARC_00193 [Sphaeroforma arctica JP610]|eukprot:XP_014161587.1 hypothetical protein SARC_00193 [Sphaeroforma arctica JP610]
MLALRTIRLGSVEGLLPASRLCVGRYKSSEAKEPMVLSSTKNGVTTLTMNNPKRLNGWTKPMMDTLFAKIEEAGEDTATKALIITGKGTYYCAGVNLADTIKPGHPQKLWEEIYVSNQKLFNTFLDCPKPVLVAANGPAIGASVTSATLCDGIIAAESATFNTPFARLSIPPEGCSSVHFQRIMGQENANKMLNDGWIPTAVEAKKAGFVLDVCKDDELTDKAQALAEKWIKDGKKREVAPDLKAVNEKESRALASAFLSTGFLNAQYEFLKSKGKTQTANVFWALKATRPVWGLFLKQ